MNAKILQKMGFKPSAHNEIYYDHLETITDFLIEQCPIESKKAISMLRGSTGISIRYVKEHIDSLVAWGIIKRSNGNFEWILEGVQPSKITIEGMINEEVPDTLPGDLGEHKPCIYRKEDGYCYFNPDKLFIPGVKKCDKCIARIET